MKNSRKNVDPRKGVSVYKRKGRYYCQYKSVGYPSAEEAIREANSIENIHNGAFEKRSEKR